MVLEKTLESPSDCKEIQLVHPKGNQSWIFIGRTDAKTETPIVWPPDMKNWLTGKDPDAEKDWSLEKGMTEDEMVGWDHLLNGLNGHEFEQALGVGDGQGGLVCCSSWDHKESDTTKLLNWTDAAETFYRKLGPRNSQLGFPVPCQALEVWVSLPRFDRGNGIIKDEKREFPGDLLVRMLRFHSRGHKLNP